MDMKMLPRRFKEIQGDSRKFKEIQGNSRKFKESQGAEDSGEGFGDDGVVCRWGTAKTRFRSTHTESAAHAPLTPRSEESPRALRQRVPAVKARSPRPWE